MLRGKDGAPPTLNFLNEPYTYKPTPTTDIWRQLPLFLFLFETTPKPSYVNQTWTKRYSCYFLFFFFFNKVKLN